MKENVKNTREIKSDERNANDENLERKELRNHCFGAAERQKPMREWLKEEEEDWHEHGS